MYNIYIYIYSFTCMYIYMHIFTHVYTYTYIHIHMFSLANSPYGCKRCVWVCLCVCERERALGTFRYCICIYVCIGMHTHKHTYTQCTYLYIYTRTHTNTNTLMYTHTGCRERLLSRSGFRRPHQVDLLSGTPLMSDSLRGVIARLPRCRNMQPMIAPSPSRFAIGHPLNEWLNKESHSRAPEVSKYASDDRTQSQWVCSLAPP